MATVTFTTRASLVAGNPENIADVTDCLDKLRTGVNSIDKEQLSTANAQLLGMNNGTNIGRGKSIIPVPETHTTGVSYGLLPTPDRVSSVVLPTDGLIVVSYQATWLESVAGAGRAAIFVGASQLQVMGKVLPGNSWTSPGPVAALTANTSVNIYTPLVSCSAGVGGTSAAYTTMGLSSATTGQAVGVSEAPNVVYDTASGNTVPGAVNGPCYIFASAGTYTISVQFKASSGTVTVNNRSLWVWTMGF